MKNTQKPFKKPKKFTRATGGPGFGFKSAYKKPFDAAYGKRGKPYGKASHKPFDNKFARPASAPTMRTTSVMGEYAPKPAVPFVNPHRGPHKPLTRPVAAAKSVVSKKIETSSSDKLGTGWGNVAQWYHDTVEGKGSYQKDLILPNLLRLMDVKKGERVLDLACGEGFFSRRFNRLGAQVTGVDISKELIEIAQRDPDARGVQFAVSPADDLAFLEDNSFNKAAIVLALQNIENVAGVLSECSRVLQKNGKLYLVLNHPAFRIPKQSGWGWDGSALQYRRVDRYLSELREKIDMHPSALRQAQGKQNLGEATVSFHRPLQYFVKALRKNGFVVTGMEEWTSNKKSQAGPRQAAEDRARAEIPLFLFIEAQKL